MKLNKFLKVGGKLSKLPCVTFSYTLTVVITLQESFHALVDRIRIAHHFMQMLSSD